MNNKCLHYGAIFSITGEVRCPDCESTWPHSEYFAHSQQKQIVDLNGRLDKVTQQLHDMAAYLSINFCDTCPELIGTTGETTAVGLTLSDPIEGDRAICKTCLLSLEERGDDLELTEVRQEQVIDWIRKYYGADPTAWPREVGNLASLCNYNKDPRLTNVEADDLICRLEDELHHTQVARVEAENRRHDHAASTLRERETKLQALIAKIKCQQPCKRNIPVEQACEEALAYHLDKADFQILPGAEEVEGGHWQLARIWVPNDEMQKSGASQQFPVSSNPAL